MNTEKRRANKEIVTLNGTSDTYYSIPSSYYGFVAFQVTDPDSSISGVLSVTLEMSIDGVSWVDAIDANGEFITGTVSIGGTILEKLSDVNNAISLRLKLTSGVTGSVLITTII